MVLYRETKPFAQNDFKVKSIGVFVSGGDNRNDFQ